MSLRDIPPRARWHRTQKFVLSPRGSEVEAEYLERIVASRSASGRDSFDAARAAWAQAHQLQPDDGLYLSELRAGPTTLSQLIARLEECGKSKADAVEAVGRLVDLGMVSTHDERT